MQNAVRVDNVVCLLKLQIAPLTWLPSTTPNDMLTEIPLITSLEKGGYRT